MNENFLLSREKVISKVKHGMIPLAKGHLLAKMPCSFCVHTVLHTELVISTLSIYFCEDKDNLQLLGGMRLLLIFVSKLLRLWGRIKRI